MAFDPILAQRVREALTRRDQKFEELKMMGGLCFKLDGKMLCGIHIDKETDESLLMARIGEEEYARQVEKEECLPMDFTGRPMKGYVFVKPEGFEESMDLGYWLQLCIDFNPQAKASKKKTKKTPKTKAPLNE